MTKNHDDYKPGYSFPRDILFDENRMKCLFDKKWFFVGTRGDVPTPKDYFKFDLFNDSYFLLHGTDGVIRCIVNRCSHQSARLVNEQTGKMSASIVCPNHSWSYHLNSGELRHAPHMPADFASSEQGKSCGLHFIPLKEVGGMLFACLGENPPHEDLITMEQQISSYVNPYGLDKAGFKLAFHRREEVDANWLLVMINNRECCHCRRNHRGLMNMFHDASFGVIDDSYHEAHKAATARWDKLGLQWKEYPFDPHDCYKINRLPLKEGFKSLTFNGEAACKKCIGPFTEHEQSTLSLWFNPNAWIHFASDHISTNWVLPINADKCALYTSWIVHADAKEGEDYTEQQLTKVWEVTNNEDVTLVCSMTEGTKSDHYRPGPFSNDERFCRQFCNWYYEYSC